MWYLTACKISDSLSFLNWVKNDYLCLQTFMQRYDKNQFISRTRDKLIFYRLSGATFYDCINTIYQFIKPFLDNKMSIFEEYGAFKSKPILRAILDIIFSTFFQGVRKKLVFPFWLRNCEWRNFASLAVHNVPSEDSDLSARMRRLIWHHENMPIYFWPPLNPTFI